MFGRDDLADRLAVALLISAVCVLAAGIVVGVTLSGTDLGGDGTTDGNVTQTDPSTLSGERDLSSFERQLAQRLQQRVESGAVNISQGQYADIRRQVNTSRYRALLDSYRSVASETGSGDRARNLTLLQRSLANYSRYAQRYATVYDTYQQVRNGTEIGVDAAAEARLVARRLERIHRNASAAGERALDRFERVDTAGLNLSTSASAIRDDLRGLTRRQESVRAVSFVETRIDVRASDRAVSFADPIVLSGRLWMDNGTVLVEQPVQLRVGNRTFNTTTNGTGGFAVTYRPVRLPAASQAVTVQFEPTDRSPFLGSEQRVPVSVSRVEPTVTVSPSPRTAGYNDTLYVRGRIGVGDAGAPDAPVVARLDGRRIGNTTTDATGNYSLNVSLPSTVPTGERRIDVTVPLYGRALASTNASTTVTVRERATSLAVDAERIDGRLVRLTGRLRTDDGRGATNQTVAVGAGAETVTTLRTRPGGRINTTVVVPRAAVGNGTVALSVRFDGQELNLGTSVATATVTVPSSGPPGWLLAFVAVVVVVVAGGLALFARRRSTAVPDAGDAPAEPVAEDAAGETVRADPETLLSLARERLRAGESDDAVRIAYAAVRVGMGATDGATHWEFYRDRAADGLDDGTAEALRDLTAAYERATYAATAVSSVEGERAIETAASVTAAGTTPT